MPERVVAHATLPMSVDAFVAMAEGLDRKYPGVRVRGKDNDTTALEFVLREDDDDE